MNTHRAHLSVVAMLVAAPLTASGAIVSVSGQAVHLSPAPPSVLAGTLRGPLIFAFDEVQSAPYVGQINVLNPGLGVFYDFNHAATPVLMLPGVTSHFVHAEPSGPSSNVVGFVTFADPIVAVIFESGFLDASDGTLGLPSVAYPTGTLNRGFSVASSGNDRFRLITPWTIEFTLGSSLDQARVFTVPTPGAVSLLAGALLVVTRRRR
jgi:hypothetical protein